MIQQNPAGWWLPKGDNYFAQFMSGLVGKKNGFMREHLLEAFKHVRAWEVAVDCGAHVGFWTWDLAQRFRTVYAFEPSKPTFDCLLKNTAEFSNVIARNSAVGDRVGWCNVVQDELRPGNTGSNYIMPAQPTISEVASSTPLRRYPHDRMVPMTALDSIDIPACDLLKIDVEGFELKVLQGAKELIGAHHPVIIMECTDKKFRGRYPIAEGAAQRWLLKRGYREVAAMRPDKVFVT